MVFVGMNCAFVFLALVTLGAASPRYFQPWDKSLDAVWEEYKRTFAKVYLRENEEFGRRILWEENYNRIKKHNLESDLGVHSYWMGINEYSDMDHEFTRTMNGWLYQDGHKAPLEFVDEDISDVPNEIDWRKHGYVTEVKNQGKCGSCWAFSATGALEGQLYKKTQKLMSLSEQDLLDCAGSCGNKGCEGGLVQAAFTCIRDRGGIESEADYPYKAKDDECRFSREKANTTLSTYANVMRFNEKALQKAVATVGPISVAIDASDFGFAQYKVGIYESTKCNPLDLDHGVLVVGYGTENGKDYWLVKNSWGPSWGMEGYIKMARNQDNMCGIATFPTYPIL